MSLKHRPYYEKHYKWELLADIVKRTVPAVKIYFWRKQMNILNQDDVRKFIVTVFEKRN